MILQFHFLSIFLLSLKAAEPLQTSPYLFSFLLKLTSRTPGQSQSPTDPSFPVPLLGNEALLEFKVFPAYWSLLRSKGLLHYISYPLVLKLFPSPKLFHRSKGLPYSEDLLHLQRSSPFPEIFPSSLGLRKLLWKPFVLKLSPTSLVFPPTTKSFPNFTAVPIFYDSNFLRAPNFLRYRPVPSVPRHLPVLQLSPVLESSPQLARPTPVSKVSSSSHFQSLPIVQKMCCVPKVSPSLRVLSFLKHSPVLLWYLSFLNSSFSS